MQFCKYTYIFMCHRDTRRYAEPSIQRVTVRNVYSEIISKYHKWIPEEHLKKISQPLGRIYTHNVLLFSVRWFTVLSSTLRDTTPRTRRSVNTETIAHIAVHSRLCRGPHKNYWSDWSEYITVRNCLVNVLNRIVGVLGYSSCARVYLAVINDCLETVKGLHGW